jgi:hypothetical protein
MNFDKTTERRRSQNQNKIQMDKLIFCEVIENANKFILIEK